MKRESLNRSDRPGRREKRKLARSYRPPQLEEYGSLKELTKTLSTQTPGDGFGASFAT